MARKKTIRRSKTIKRKDSVRLTFPRVGEILDNRFELVLKLGEGAYSITFKAFDNTVNAYKALKVFGLYSEVFNNITEIREEAKIFAGFRVPHFPIFNKLHDSQYIYFELEYIDSTDLYDKLSHGISSTDKIDYAVQLADALFYLHFRGIEHLDIKPENILIDTRKRVFVIDFGTAVFQKENTNELEGTTHYLPPEALRFENVKYQRDIFAYGIVLYELFHKKYPFQINEDDTINYRIPEKLLRSNKRIDKIIKRCLQFRPEDRYQNFQEIIDDFDSKMKAENTAFNTVTKMLIRKVPLRNLSEDFKKDLKYLYSSLIGLFIALPFLVLMNNHIMPVHKMVDIQAPYTVHVNGHYQGEPPLKAELKKGDMITLMANNDQPIFETEYTGGSKLKITQDGIRFYKNRRLKGMVLNRDTMVPSTVEFVNINGEIYPERLTRRFTNLKYIAVTTAAPRNTLESLPKNLKSVSLRYHQYPIDIEMFGKYPNLKKLDLANTRGVNVSDIPIMPKLEVLNIENTRTSRINGISRLRNLKHLNLKNNYVSDLSALAATQELVSVNLENNNDDVDLFPLNRLTKLRTVHGNYDNLPNDQIRIINRVAERQSRESIGHEKSLYRKQFIFTHIVNVLILSLFALIIFQLIKIGTRKGVTDLNRNLPIKQYHSKDKGKPAEVSEANKVDLNNFQVLDRAISDKRYYYPERNNALFFLRGLLDKYPYDNQLNQRKEEIFAILEEKIKQHIQRKEYEPVYLASKALNHYFPNKKFFKIFTKSEKYFVKDSPLKMIFVKGGEFRMGDFINNTIPLHSVLLNSFKISDTQITNGQFCKFLNARGNVTEGGVNWIKVDSPYSRILFGNGVFYTREPYEAFPVYEVSWFGAQRYCEWMGGRLPTEAEWEYVARSRGETQKYATGNKISKDTANYTLDRNDIYWHSVYPVKSYPSNKLGMYEMSGNILEWCFDWYDKGYYSESPSDNPRGPKNGENKVVRGGAWCFPEDQATTYYRGSTKPATRNNFVGFRMVIPEG